MNYTICFVYQIFVVHRNNIQKIYFLIGNMSFIRKCSFLKSSLLVFEIGTCTVSVPSDFFSTVGPAVFMFFKIHR